MDFLQLKYFCHAAATESFAKTAREFSVPASTISISIRRLETELATTLFTRTANRVKLNSQGKLFYSGIKEALDLIDRTTKSVCSRPDIKQLKVGILLNRHFVVQCIRRFREQYPGIDVTHSKITLNSPTNTFDAIVADDSLQDDCFSREHVFRDRIVLVSAKGLLPSDDIALKEALKTCDFASTSSGTTMYRDTIHICETMGFVPNITVPEGNSHYFLQRFVEDRRGAVLIPRNTPWVSFIEEQLDIREVGEFYRNTFLYFNRHNASPAAIRFYQFLLDAYRSNYILNAI